MIIAVALAFALAAPPAPAPKMDPDREKKELRLVEIVRMMQKKPAPDAAAQKAIFDEYKGLLMFFAGVDPKNPPKDPAAQQKAQEAMMLAQGEILGRRDPALRDQLEHDLKAYACKSKQSEAKANLKGIAVGERAWFEDEKKGYSKDLKEIGAVMDSKRYTIAVVDVKPAHFLVRATGKDDMAGDVWEVDEGGTPRAVTDICAK